MIKFLNDAFQFLIQIRNTRNVNRTGQLTGYKLVPGSNCLPLAGSEAKFLRRATFLKHNLWVTPYARDEKYPGGEFPNQNPRVGEGLATWVNQNRSLEEADIVLWLVLFLYIYNVYICNYLVLKYDDNACDCMYVCKCVCKFIFRKICFMYHVNEMCECLCMYHLNLICQRTSSLVAFHPLLWGFYPEVKSSQPSLIERKKIMILIMIRQ